MPTRFNGKTQHAFSRLCFHESAIHTAPPNSSRPGRIHTKHFWPRVANVWDNVVKLLYRVFLNYHIFPFGITFANAIVILKNFAMLLATTLGFCLASAPHKAWEHGDKNQYESLLQTQNGHVFTRLNTNIFNRMEQLLSGHTATAALALFSRKVTFPGKLVRKRCDIISGLHVRQI